MKPPVPEPRTLVLAGPLAAALVLLVVAAPAAAQQAPPATTAVESWPLLSEFHQAWARNDADGVVALFAPDGVVVLDPQAPNGPDVYYGTAAAVGLRAGVHQLMADGAQISVAGHRAASVVGTGVPTTRLTWAYGRAGIGPAVPPEVGEDEVVLRGGQIVSYTRVPDGAVRAVRARALASLLLHPASGAARVARGAQGSEPADGLHPAAALCSLAALASLVLLKRRPRPARSRA